MWGLGKVVSLGCKVRLYRVRLLGVRWSFADKMPAGT